MTFLLANNMITVLLIMVVPTNDGTLRTFFMPCLSSLLEMEAGNDGRPDSLLYLFYTVRSFVCLSYHRALG